MCLSQAVEAFVRDTEELCGRRSVSLRGALQSQANRFVHRFHDERKTKLRWAAAPSPSRRGRVISASAGSVSCLCSLLLDNERWKQAEVPAEFQDLVDSIADGRITLPDRKVPGTPLRTRPPKRSERNSGQMKPCSDQQDPSNT